MDEPVESEADQMASLLDVEHERKQSCQPASNWCPASEAGAKTISLIGSFIRHSPLALLWSALLVLFIANSKRAGKQTFLAQFGLSLPTTDSGTPKTEARVS